MPHLSAASARAFARRHWFLLLTPFWAAASIHLRLSLDWRDDARLGEAALLFDWCVFLPALYAFSLRRALPLRAILLRALGASCAGLWIAGLLVPDAAERLLRDLAWLRYAEQAGLVLLEGAAALAMLRLLLCGRADAAALAREGVPPFVARLMLAEARFWRWVWAKVRGR